jgi:hypothetical protein
VWIGFKWLRTECCETAIEPLGFMKGRELLDQLIDY